MTLPMASILATLGEAGAGSISRLSIVGDFLMPSAGVGRVGAVGVFAGTREGKGPAAAFASAGRALCSVAAGRRGATDVVMKTSTSR